MVHNGEDLLAERMIGETAYLVQKGVRTPPVIRWENREGPCFRIESYVAAPPLAIDPLPMVVVAIHSGRTLSASVVDRSSEWEGETTSIPYRTMLTPVDVDVHWRGPRGTFWVQLIYTSGAAQEALRKLIGDSRVPIQIDDQVLPILARQLLEIAKAPADPLTKRYAKHVIATFSAHLEWLACGHRDDMMCTSDPAINETLLYIHAHAGDTLTIAQLAALQKMSPAHLRRRFQAVVGMPVHRYIIKYRVEQAHELIEGSTLPLSKIAVQCGFSSLQHMSSTFLRMLGVTPGIYRGRGAAKPCRNDRPDSSSPNSYG